MDFILSSIGRLESEKHSLVLKEVLGLTNLFPHLLTTTVINRVASMEDGASSITRSYIQVRTGLLLNLYFYYFNFSTFLQELKNDFNSRCSSISKEHLLTSEVTNVTSGITIVRVRSSKWY